MDIVRCVSCDGYGWFEDEETFADVDCDWCNGTGYVYRDENGVDYPIPEADYPKVAATLENLDIQRMREMGYSGEPLHPEEQPIRKRDDDENEDHA